MEHDILRSIAFQICFGVFNIMFQIFGGDFKIHEHWYQATSTN